MSQEVELQIGEYKNFLEFSGELLQRYSGFDMGIEGVAISPEFLEIYSRFGRGVQSVSWSGLSFPSSSKFIVPLSKQFLQLANDNSISEDGYRAGDSLHLLRGDSVIVEGFDRMSGKWFVLDPEWADRLREVADMKGIRTVKRDY